MKTKSFILTLGIILPAVLSAVPSIKAMPGNRESIYRNGEDVVFRFQVTEDGRPAGGYILLYTIEREDFIKPEFRYAPTDDKGFAELKLKPGKPGSIRVLTTVCTPDRKAVTKLNRRKKAEPVRTLIGAMIDPEKLTSPFPEPADFDRFWQRAKAELAAVPLEVLECEEITPPKALTGKVKAFDLKISAPGPRPVSGILTIPANAGPKTLPAVLLVQGAGVHSARVSIRAPEHNAIYFEINAHGILNRQPAKYYLDLEKGELKDYIFRVATDEPEKSYFKYMMLRGVRALEYLRSRPEWDGRILVTNGGSQGGAQALIIAGLDPNVTFCRANIPWLTVPAAPAAGRLQVKWPRLVHLDKDNKVTNPQAVHNLAYFDAANFAPRIKAECFISYGLADFICPPSGVWMTYLRIPGKKTIIGGPTVAHGTVTTAPIVGDYMKRAAKK